MATQRRIREEHYQQNKAWWEKEGHLLTHPFGGFLEEQPKMTPIKYGVHRNILSRFFLEGRMLTGRENVCEVMGVYNVLWALERERLLEGKMPEEYSFPSLLKYFEHHGIWMSGYFGTWPFAMISFLKRAGYDVKVLWGKAIQKEKIEALQGQGAYLLMTMNNRKSIWDMVHTMCISKEEKGYRLHNDYEGNRLYPTLEEAVFGYHGGKGRPILFLQVVKK